MARKKTWSYLSGERGRNRVRVFEKRPGQFFAEWKEDGKKKRALLRGVNHADEAKKKADEIAAEFGKLEDRQQAPTTMKKLMETYLEEVSVTKGLSKRQHDYRAARAWSAFFNFQPEASRRVGRDPSTLDRVDWDRFVSSRRAGIIPGWSRSVRDRQVGYDLAFMITALNWATGRKANGRPVLEINPWGSELRRSQRWGFPREKNPHRPGMTQELREGLIAHGPSWQFELALVLERETRRRNSAIRQLRWSDLDLVAKTVQWRGDSDKSGNENMTPLTQAAVEALRHAPARGIGNTPVFPSATDSSQPTPRNTFQIWLRRSKDRWLDSVPEEERENLRDRLRGIGFHAEKRAGVRDPNFRALPPAIQEAWAGTRYETLRTVYDEVTADDIREAIRTQEKAVQEGS